MAPVYWAMEMVAGIAENRARQGLKRWEPTEPLQGAVIFIGSVSSLGNKGQIAYAATKAGLEGAAATFMMEAVFHGVRCGVIHPGYTDTPMVRALGEKPHTRTHHSQDAASPAHPAGRDRRCDLLHDLQCRGERVAVGGCRLASGRLKPPQRRDFANRTHRRAGAARKAVSASTVRHLCGKELRGSPYGVFTYLVAAVRFLL